MISRQKNIPKKGVRFFQKVRFSKIFIKKKVHFLKKKRTFFLGIYYRKFEKGAFFFEKGAFFFNI